MAIRLLLSVCCRLRASRTFFSLQKRSLTTECKQPNSSTLGLPIGGIAGLFGSMLGVGGGVIMVNMESILICYHCVVNRMYAGPAHGV